MNNERSMSWSEVAELTHETQVEQFGYCTCEDGPNVYDDCPYEETVTEYTVKITVVSSDSTRSGDSIGDILDDHLNDIGEIADLVYVAGVRVNGWVEVSA